MAFEVPYNEWTSCEVHGHNFVEGHCTDCGENSERDDESNSLEDKTPESSIKG